MRLGVAEIERVHHHADVRRVFARLAHMRDFDQFKRGLMDAGLEAFVVVPVAVGLFYDDAALEQQAVQGQLDPGTVARIGIKLSEPGMTIEKAVDAVHKEMQQEQADAKTDQGGQVPGVPGAVPGMPGGQMGAPPEADPSQQPGLASPQAAQGADAGVPSVSPPPQGLDNLKQLLGALHQQPQGQPA